MKSTLGRPSVLNHIGVREWNENGNGNGNGNGSAQAPILFAEVLSHFVLKNCFSRIYSVECSTTANPERSCITSIGLCP